MLRFKSESGSALSEFIICILPVLLLMSACFELSRWYIHRQVLYHALHEAARAGAAHHADSSVIDTTFLQTVSLLYPNEQKQVNFYKEYPLDIRVLSPTKKDFEKYKIRHPSGQTLIRNTFLLEQSKKKPGIYQANTLILELNHPYIPLFPWFNTLLRWQDDFFQIKLTHYHAMQSHVLSAGAGQAIKTPLSKRPRQPMISDKHPSYDDSSDDVRNIKESAPDKEAYLYKLLSLSGEENRSILPYDQGLCGVNVCCE
ncbi:TadE family protein [Basilea psittacipulmonis]|uniref:TadE-like domain-containing protein n=1 Tax=Basilea psittacipulmonis DSM 24701 TaxID=1072685 RepID=A0A077DEG7_9BURK|nr:TadE family protein [Basilea psittacipulmonis]AIL33124.1 hypothetical protein IX83_07280 [Basilea psittacipulmonis DSM 24701]